MEDKVQLMIDTAFSVEGIWDGVNDVLKDDIRSVLPNCFETGNREYEKVKGLYKLSKSVMDDLKVKDDLKILHPLPRVDEMDESLDTTNYAVYFQQAHSGIPVRETLLASVLGAIK